MKTIEEDCEHIWMTKTDSMCIEIVVCTKCGSASSDAFTDSVGCPVETEGAYMIAEWSVRGITFYFQIGWEPYTALYLLPTVLIGNCSISLVWLKFDASVVWGT